MIINSSEIDNMTYRIIGEIALMMSVINMKISYRTLIRILSENNIDGYTSERAMASGISAAYRHWKRIEKEDDPINVSQAIAYTYVNQHGNPSWMDYE